ncbi:MAG TPA: hypothetical protein VJ901_12170 [Thermoanaerobaculia bacterium]|nr:hypothetical protein [Thermoanaerobaculia bacterium]
MKRSVAEVIRRGFDITLNNWPLLLIRIAEHVILGVLAIASIVAIVVPIAVSAGLGHFDIDPDNPNGAAGIIAQALIDHWGLFLFILLLITVVLIVFVVIHSFVQAGSTDVYIANQFTGDRFMHGGKRGWSPVFWIYNLAWLVAGIVLLIPLAPVPFIILAIGESVGSIVVGCLWMAIWGFFAILVFLATSLWVMKAIVIAMTRNVDAREALRQARAEIRAQPGAHFAVGFIMLVIWFGGSAFIGMFSGFASMGHATPLAIITAPLHLFLSFINAIFSAAVESWFLASLVSLE